MDLRDTQTAPRDDVSGKAPFSLESTMPLWKRVLLTLVPILLSVPVSMLAIHIINKYIW